MCLKRYIINLRKLSIQECKQIYCNLEKQSFISNPKDVGIYEVFWDSSTPIEKSIDFPIGTIISQI